MRFTQLAQVMPTTGSESSVRGSVGGAVIAVQHTTGEYPAERPVEGPFRRSNPPTAARPLHVPRRRSRVSGCTSWRRHPRTTWLTTRPRPTPVRPPVVFVVDDDVHTLDLLCEIAREAGWLAKGFTRISGLRRSLDTGNTDAAHPGRRPSRRPRRRPCPRAPRGRSIGRRPDPGVHGRASDAAGRDRRVGAGRLEAVRRCRGRGVSRRGGIGGSPDPIATGARQARLGACAP